MSAWVAYGGVLFTLVALNYLTIRVERLEEWRRRVELCEQLAEHLRSQGRRPQGRRSQGRRSQGRRSQGQRSQGHG